MSNVSSVTSHFATANEGFLTTLGSSILAGAVTMSLTSTTGLTNGSVFVGIIEPGLSREQTFTGIVDTGGSQLTGVVWTRGTNVDHTGGVTIVDYVTGTDHNMMAKGILVAHNQDGTHKTSIALTTPKITTSINDANGNEVIKTPATSSAVNEITVTNAATGNAPRIAATGGDTNLNLKIAAKGTGFLDFETSILTGVVSQANAGSAGGTIYKLNLGGIKICWGITADISTSTATPGKIVTFPASFFTTVQYLGVTPTDMTSTGNQYGAIAGYTTTDMTIYIYCQSGTGTAKATFYAIGT